MARHAQPRELAALKGADKRNPQRYRKDAPKSAVPLGNAPDHLTATQKECWFELQSYALEGVLTGADRMMMELASKLLSESREDWAEFSAARMGHLVGILARLGLSPADRQKLGAVKEDGEANPFASI